MPPSRCAGDGVTQSWMAGVLSAWRHAPMRMAEERAGGLRLKRLALFLCAMAAVGMAPAHVISPRQLVQIVDISNVATSPDGKLVAFRTESASIERNTYKTHWYVQPLEEHAPPRRISEGGVLLRESDGFSLVPVDATWSPDSRWLYFRALVDDGLQVWRAAADGSEAGPVTHDPADVRGFVLSADGARLRYRVGASRRQVLASEQAEYDQGILIDETVPLAQGLFRSGYLEERLATQRLQGDEVIRHPLLAGVPDRWKEVELATGEVREIPAPGNLEPEPTLADVKNAVPGFWKHVPGAAGGQAAVLYRPEGEPQSGAAPVVALAVMGGTNSGRLVRCMHRLCTGRWITSAQWRPGTDEILYTVTDREKSQAQSIYRWNVTTGEVTTVVDAAGLLNGGRDVYSPCGATWRFLVCVEADARRPPFLERVDLETGERTRMFDPNAALARDMADMAVHTLEWSDAQGNRFNGQYYPARSASDAEPPPLFVTYYRCSGFVRGGAGDEWPLVSMAGHGISALCINAPPHDSDALVRYELGRSAVESVVDLLAAKGEVDRSRVGMGGLSFGTEVVLWVTMYSDVLAAASVSSIAFSPLAYLLMSMQGEAFFSRLEEHWQLGDPAVTPERWRHLSPVFNLDRITVPVLMQMPEQEYLLSLDYAVPLVRKQLAEMYVFPNEPHQKFQPKHKLAVYERNLDWFRFWLQEVEDPRPGKRDQYGRWRAMARGSSVVQP